MSSDEQIELLSAVYRNDLPEVKNIIGTYGLSCSEANGYVILRIAVEKHFFGITKYLLEEGCKVNSSNSKTRPTKTPLHYAVLRGNVELVQMLLNRGADIDAVDRKRRTPLYLAIERKHEKIVQVLLSNGAFIHKIINGTTYLEASLYIPNAKIVRLLVHHGSSVNTSGCANSTPLLSAVKSKNEGIVKLFLLKGAGVNVKGDNGETPLHVAAENGLLNIVEMLLNYGADFMAKDLHGKTALHFACAKGKHKTVEVLLEFGYAKFNGSERSKFLDFIDTKDQLGTTPLMVATKNGFENVVEILLNFGADVSIVNNDGITALHVASQEGHFQFVNIFLKFGADINSVTNQGFTALYFAKKSISLISSSYHINGCLLVEKILKEHIIKLNAAGLYVSAENLRMCRNKKLPLYFYPPVNFNFYPHLRADMDDNGGWVDSRCNLFHKKCIDELNIMKSHYIVNGISFHDIVTKSMNEVAVYMRNELLVRSINSLENEKIFPLYSIIVYNHFKVGLKRKEVLEECGKLLFSDVNSDLSRLPYICVEKILFYLSND